MSEVEDGYAEPDIVKDAIGVLLVELVCDGMCGRQAKLGWVNCYGVLCASVKFGTGTRCMRVGGTYLDDRQLEHQSAVFTQKRQFSVLLGGGGFEEYEEGGRDRRGQRVEREDESGEWTERPLHRALLFSGVYPILSLRAPKIQGIW